MKMERKTYSILEATEYVLADYKEPTPSPSSPSSPSSEDSEDQGPSEAEKLRKLQEDIVAEIYPKNFEGKTIWQIPNSYVASRNLELPVTQRKKVELMVPFQLDENLPFPSSEAHYFCQMEKLPKSTKVLANIAKKSHFLEYYNRFNNRGILPMYLTSELSCVHAHAQNRNIKGPVAILDIGHTTSKCYIIYNGEVVEHHFSYCAGSTIDEVISETYNIDRKEAAIYKHDNCFFLTESQYDEVSEDQKAFALLMKKAMNPLTLELKRWLLGFRIKFGLQVETIFLTGGTSNIHNIGNFISQAVNVKTDYLDMAGSFVNYDEMLEGRESNFFNSMLMGIGLSSKVKPGNFLFGEYANGSGVSLPLHTTSMLLYRSAVLTFVFGALMGLEYYFLKGEEKQIDAKIKSLARNKSLNISVSARRNIDRNLSRIQSIVRKKHDDIKQEVSTLSSATQLNALPPLFKVFQIISADPKVTLLDFKTDGVSTQGSFQVSDSAKLKDIESNLINSGLANMKTEIAGDKVKFAFNQ